MAKRFKTRPCLNVSILRAREFGKFTQYLQVQCDEHSYRTWLFQPSGLFYHECILDREQKLEEAAEQKITQVEPIKYEIVRQMTKTI